ncbi:MAG: CocE/NonD family hydrolase [Planctomycetota bacterium]
MDLTRTVLASSLALATTAPLAQLSDIDPADVDAQWIAENYTKREVYIPMRDGVRLYTSIYEPKDRSETYPFMMKRTPYTIRPYGENAFPSYLGPHPAYAAEGYIFIYQDVRGKNMSEGTFVNMTPHVPQKNSPTDIDESSDTYDTLEWLLANVQNHNNKAGLTGISYPGFYSAASMIDHHPALVAVSPQAPIADWWYDDFHHHGALFLPHGFNFLSSFGLPREGPTQTRAPRPFTYPTVDGYDFYLNHVGELETLRTDAYVGQQVDFWNQIIAHPNYDEFWQSRNIVPHLKNVSPNVLTVGGWFDAEDLYGPLKIYASSERNNPLVNNKIVMGPWRHGGWARSSGEQLGDQYFAPDVSEYYRTFIEQPWFKHHLKGKGDKPEVAEATMYETGRNYWHNFSEWPPASAQTRSLYMHDGGKLGWTQPRVSDSPDSRDSFVSDPDAPVPYTETVSIGMVATYMTEDQRFASRRPDVLVYQTDVLEEDVTIAGEILADLWVSTTGSAADWVVKVIDVQPGDTPNTPAATPGNPTAGSHYMVRSEVIRGRFRESPSEPKPFTPNEITKVELPLQDTFHTFKKGHRIMVHIQSTWFPLVDRNPQTYLDNPYLAKAEDFTKQTHTVHRSRVHASRLQMGVIPADQRDLTIDPRFSPTDGIVGDRTASSDD